MEDKKKTLLLSEDKMKKETLIQKNVSARILAATLRKVQNEKLQNVLGFELYDTVLNEAYNKATIDGYILSEGMIELINDYIQPYLLHTTIAQLFDTLDSRITNKGIKKKNDDNSTSLDQTELDNLRHKYTNDSIHYKSQLIDYLITNNLASGSNDLTHGSFEATGVLFDTDSTCKPTKKSGGIWSGKSWSPLTVFEIYDGKLIKKITGYTGGEGELPQELQSRIGMYFGDGSLVFDPIMAIDFRGNGDVDKTFEWEQVTPSNEWKVTHNLGKKPTIAITDTAHSVFIGEIEYVDKNNVIIRFNFPLSGYAYFN